MLLAPSSDHGYISDPSTAAATFGEEFVQISSATPPTKAFYGQLNPLAPSAERETILRYCPVSKAAIGTLTYELKQLPELFVAEKKTLVKPVGTGLAENAAASWDDVRAAA
jgi:hypothetical protein